ncbi:MAG: hypothetical protein ABI426_06345 [Flavobacterium sp.]
MKTIKLLIPALFISMVSCQKDDLEPKNPTPTEVQSLNESGRYYDEFRVYVMDSRFSRTTCATGPGVCFQDGFGNIWDYAFIDNSDDPEVGPIGVSIVNDRLSLSFYRSLEEDKFIIERDVTVNPSLARALGKRTIILKAGIYPVSFERFANGESTVNTIMR